MRILFAVAAAFVAFAAPAFAQQAPTPSHLAAARTALHTLLAETGAVEAASSRSFEILAPQFRAQFQNTPLYPQLTPAHQQALNAYFDRFGPIAAREVVLNLPTIYDQFAPRVAAIFT